jgi:hypothetical protein
MNMVWRVVEVQMPLKQMKTWMPSFKLDFNLLMLDFSKQDMELEEAGGRRN